MPRVLFVDDDPNVLSGLRRALRRLPPTWELAFAGGAAEALELLEASSFNAVVSDMRMPGMNGADLLIRVKERWPQTIRFILSGYSETEVVMRTVAVAHRFLSKPCDAALVRESLERAFAVEELLADPRLRDAIGALSTLPALPATYRRITQALSDPSSDIDAIARIVETDTAMSAKLLQLVNSAFFGLQQEINDLLQAIAYLGIDTIRDLVLSLEVFRPADGSEDGSREILEQIQAESTRVAVLARRLCPDPTLGGCAFTAGLLHDVGAVVLATRFPSEYRAICDQARASGRSLCDAERERWGLHHGEVGACLLGVWGLPHSIIEAVAYHHDPRALPQTSVGSLTYVHAALGLQAEDAKDVFPESRQLDSAYLDGLGLSERLPEWRRLAAADAGEDRAA